PARISPSASSTDMSGPTMVGSAVIQWVTWWPGASKSCDRARTMSRSVKMPRTVSPSMTSAEPTCLPPITVAASATVEEGATEMIPSCMTSRIVAIAFAEPTLWTRTAKVPRAYPARVDANRELLRWYRPRRAAYPWRTGAPDPYRTLVSEVMLQQTQAPRV